MAFHQVDRPVEVVGLDFSRRNLNVPEKNLRPFPLNAESSFTYFCCSVGDADGVIDARGAVDARGGAVLRTNREERLRETAASSATPAEKDLQEKRRNQG